MKLRWTRRGLQVAPLAVGAWFLLSNSPALGQLTDQTQTPNAAGSGIAKSFEQQIGAGRGDAMTPDSSTFIITRDPFRAIRRGRQLFQRKFTIAQGWAPRTGDGIGDIQTDASIGAGMSDSCAACHGRPRGAAGAGGDVYTRPDSRDAPHLFGLGLKEMLADEITTNLRAIRDNAIERAMSTRTPVTMDLVSKGINYGSIVALPDGTIDTSLVEGVNPDLRVRPFFHDGRTISIREFVVGALNAEMGLEAPDPDLLAASQGKDVLTPAGMLLKGSLDYIEPPPVSSATEDCDGDGVVNEIPTAIVDHFEFYLLNYFKAGTYQQTGSTKRGLDTFASVGCTDCHKQNLLIEHDRRVADVQTEFSAKEPGFNHLFATAKTLYKEVNDGSGFPTTKVALGGKFLVQNIFTDFKRHDLGPNFHERHFNGTVTTEFMTEPLWGVGTTAPYGHDGRSINLMEVILRHGGEAQTARDAFANLPAAKQALVLEFLNSLVLFPPDDTASNLNTGDPGNPGFPQFGHGSINLGALFNDPTEKE